MRNKENFVINNNGNLDKARNKYSIFYENCLFNYFIKCLLIQNFINILRTKEVYSKLSNFQNSTIQNKIIANVKELNVDHLKI